MQSWESLWWPGVAGYVGGGGCVDVRYNGRHRDVVIVVQGGWEWDDW
jgi:hypothetical protein